MRAQGAGRWSGGDIMAGHIIRNYGHIRGEKRHINLLYDFSFKSSYFARTKFKVFISIFYTIYFIIMSTRI